MPAKLIFLSHIHEERELAISLKTAIEDEFGGFVDVFVSSDGTSIPAGANFLKRIEDGLVECIAALYLISPISVKRNWVNFELGAVWVRSAISERAGGNDIPALPVCHSGITPGQMPAPLNNLNGITASQASSLEFGFASLQRAVGGKGKLRTDFDALASKVQAFEHQYTVGANLLKALRLVLLQTNMKQLVAHCEQIAPKPLDIACGFVTTEVIAQLQQMQGSELKGVLSVKTENPGTVFRESGAVNGAALTISLPSAEVVKIKDQLLAQ